MQSNQRMFKLDLGTPEMSSQAVKLRDLKSASFKELQFDQFNDALHSKVDDKSKRLMMQSNSPKVSSQSLHLDL